MTQSQNHDTSRNQNAANTGLDFAAEDKFWRQNHESQPYFEKDRGYDEYAPAYRVGYEGHGRYDGTRFDDVEDSLRGDYESGTRGSASLGWDKVKSAARAAWDRVERALPGDSDRDGK